jgi:hypothetical protein
MGSTLNSNSSNSSEPSYREESESHIWAKRTFLVSVGQLLTGVVTTAVAILSIIATLYLYNHTGSGDVRRAPGVIEGTQAPSHEREKGNESERNADGHKSQDSSTHPQGLTSIAEAQAQPILTPRPESIQKPLEVPRAGRVLILVSETVDGQPIIDGPVTGRLSQMVGSSLTVTSGSELGAVSVEIRRAIQKMQAGDRAAGQSIPFAIVLLGNVSSATRNSYEGQYVAFAVGTLKAIKTTDGGTVALENISAVRGFGITKDQAAREALMNASEHISVAFFNQVSARAR